MNRRSLIKSLFTIAIAPKILAELNLETPLVAKNEFAGIIPTLLRPEYNVVNYEPGSFTLKHFHDLIKKADEQYKPKYSWYEKAPIHNG
jgi:hypothetical protein